MSPVSFSWSTKACPKLDPHPKTTFKGQTSSLMRTSFPKNDVDKSQNILVYLRPCFPFSYSVHRALVYGLRPIWIIISRRTETLDSTRSSPAPQWILASGVEPGCRRALIQSVCHPECTKVAWHWLFSYFDSRKRVQFSSSASWRHS